MVSVVIIEEISHYGEVEKTWAEDNCPSFFMSKSVNNAAVYLDLSFWSVEFYFKDQKDAMLFNLKFGGELLG